VIVPALVVGLPLALIALAAQILGGLAFLPAIRRQLGSLGLSRRMRRDAG
jgi:hypothetical protein